MATHNGYTNYETWSVINTIANTESLNNFFKDWVKEIKNNTTDEVEVRSKTVDLLKKVVDSMKPTSRNPIWEPLLNAVIADHINFLEIANTMLEEW